MMVQSFPAISGESYEGRSQANNEWICEINQDPSSKSSAALLG